MTSKPVSLHVLASFSSSEESEQTEEDRDFVGHDFTSWMYDLSRPDEPYEARGAHPSGNGINRYRSYDDLDDRAKKFLRLQGQLTFLNLLDSMLFVDDGFDDFFNIETLKLQHVLTSFGYTLNIKSLMKLPGYEGIVTLNNFRNGRRWGPGLQLKVRETPNQHVPTWTVRAGLWNQPKNLRFDDTQFSFGGYLGLGYRKSLSESLFLEPSVYSKTKGWMMGSPYQQRALQTEMTIGMIF